MEDPVPTQRRNMPFHALHLAQRQRPVLPTLLEWREQRRPYWRQRAGAADEGLQKTTVDLTLQQTVERLLAQSDLPAPLNAAALVVEHAAPSTTGLPIRAYVGSAHFFAADRLGQVDMVQAIRSPGSTLKPLIYGLAFEEGMVHPNTLIRDIPMRFGNYAPSNFHHAFHGQVAVKTALQQSLNVPAVQLLEQVGPLRVTGLLRQHHISLHTPEDLPAGLPLVLGGVGISLWDLTTLYAATANAGKILPLTTVEAVLTTPNPSGQLMSPQAAHTVSAILADAPLPPGIGSAHRRRAIAFKTGTSYGYRDAWAMGFDGRFTVGVWVGRVDGSPSPGHFGRVTAAPLLWRIFENLPPTPLNLREALPMTAVALPTRLQRFQPVGPLANPIQGGAPLRLRFPVNGAKIEMPRDEQGALLPLPLRAQGGRRPLRFFVNGVPLPINSSQRHSQWQPDGIGAVTVTVIDDTGQRVTHRAWLH